MFVLAELRKQKDYTLKYRQYGHLHWESDVVWEKVFFGQNYITDLQRSVVQPLVPWGLS